MKVVKIVFFLLLSTYVAKAQNVGIVIGIAAPAQALDVTDFIHSSGLNGGVTSLSVDASGNIIRTPSDARLKCEIAPIENALSKLHLL